MQSGKIRSVNGWALFGHPVFLNRLEAIVSEVDRLTLDQPDEFIHHPVYKLFEKVSDSMLEDVPQNPLSPAFLQGNTLGKENRHWRRVKNGLPNRYRLFFQCRSEAPKSIIYAWLNDDATLRKAGSKSDVYAVFKAMLNKGAIPTTYAELLASSTSVP